MATSTRSPRRSTNADDASTRTSMSGCASVKRPSRGTSQDAAKKLAKALKSGAVMPAAGESSIDAALAAGVIDAVEAEQLQMAELARRKVIGVDDFAKEDLELQEGRIR